MDDGFDGAMDEVRIWGVVRSAAQIQRWMRERIDAGKKIPGVSMVQVKELSVHKIK